MDGVLRGAGERWPTSGSTPTSGRPGPRCGSGCGTGWPRPTARRRPRPRDLRRPPARRRPASADLLENLRVNGHVDGDGNYVDKRALLALRPGRAEPRAGVLPAPPRDPRRHPGQTRRAPGGAVCTMGPDDFADIADATLAARILAELDGTYLADRRVPTTSSCTSATAAARSGSGWTWTRRPRRRSASASPP